MSNKNAIGVVLAAAGIVLLVLSLTADVIGVGQEPGFGYKQIAGAVAGVLAAAAGFVLRSRGK